MNDPANDDLDRRLDGVLRAAFTPPPAEVIAARALPRTGVRRRVGMLAAAAALLVFAAAAWMVASASGRGRTTARAALPALWVAAYHDAVARGFEERACCDGDIDLQRRCREMFAAALALAPRAGIELCGGYCGQPAGGAAAMLARADGEPVCLFVLPREAAPPIESGEHDGLRIHRREVGGLVAFEVSRLPSPRVLPHLYEPEG
ncbi:MAG TPA: hypothetical protein VK081_05140 [Planctomycetota bacterium]|nr:hypothetical protein [Planctomycetota bacterium]